MSDGYRELSPADRFASKTLEESVDRAVAESADDDRFNSAEAALRHLLKLAWYELDEARRSALNGVWSLKCDHAVHKIVGLTDLVYPISWREVPTALVRDGVFERVHEQAGWPTPLSEG